MPHVDGSCGLRLALSALLLLIVGGRTLLLAFFGFVLALVVLFPRHRLLIQKKLKLCERTLLGEERCFLFEWG